MRCHQLLPSFVSKEIASCLHRRCALSRPLCGYPDTESMRQLHVSANKDYQPPKQGQTHQKVPKSTDSLKSSRNVHTHPSKDREKARRLEQDRKARRWEASSASVSSSGDWADQYFDEKWVHKQGRLSDWRPAPATLQQAARSARTPRKGRQTERLLEHRPQDDKPSLTDPLTESEGRAGTIPSSAAEEQDSSQGAGRGRLRFFATCHPGLESSVAFELSSPEIQAENISPGRAGVSFGGGTLETGYRACLWLRCAIRVLVLLAEGPVDSQGPGGDTIYAWTRCAADWPALLGRGQRFSVEARVWDCRNITSTRLVATRVRDAICDAVRETRGEKLWPPDAHHPPDVPMYVALYRDHCSLYRDMAGTSLHRRGYRSAMHRASLNEAAAAGLLTLAGWPNKCSVLADPMCGSGTFLIEAALMAQGRAPGLSRRLWPFVAWPDFDPNVWRACAADAGEHKREPDVRFLGNDVHHGAVGLALRDAHAAGVSHLIRFSHGSCAAWSPQSPPDMVITNPPWGERLGGPGQMEQSQEGSGPQVEGSGTDNGKAGAAWRDLGTFLKGQCPNANAYILTGSRELSHELHMRTSQKFAVGIGGMDCRLLKYKILPPKVYGPGV